MEPALSLSGEGQSKGNQNEPYADAKKIRKRCKNPRLYIACFRLRKRQGRRASRLPRFPETLERHAKAPASHHPRERKDLLQRRPIARAAKHPHPPMTALTSATRRVPKRTIRPNCAFPAASRRASHWLILASPIEKSLAEFGLIPRCKQRRIPSRYPRAYARGPQLMI